MTAASRLSSGWAKALAVAAAVAVGAAAAGVVYAQSRDDDRPDRRPVIAAYIADVNMTQQELVLELTRINEAYAALKLRTAALRKQNAKLAKSERTLATLRERLGELTPPVEAANLHEALLGLLDLQVAFAAEVAQLGRYVPVEAAEQQKVVVATQALSKALSGATTAAAQQAALGRYARAIDIVATTLDEAEAPPVLEPSRSNEAKRLRRLVALARRLSSSLTGGTPEQVDRLFRSFAQTTAATGTTLPERRAVIAFNRRLRGIADQRAVVNEQRVALNRLVR